MAITTGKYNTKDGGGTSKDLKAQLDSSDTTVMPVHSISDGAGAIISPATSGKQDTGNTSLATIATNIPAQGQALAAGSMPVVLTAAQITSLTAPVLAAGTNVIGAVTPPGTVHLTAAPTVTAGAYTTGQVLGTGANALSGAARVNTGSGMVQNVIVTCKTALTAPFDVLFFDTNPTNSTFTDNAALALNVADLPFLCGVAHCTDIISGGTPQIFQMANAPFAFKLSAAATSLYAVIVMRGAETLASTSAIGLSVVILQD